MLKNCASPRLSRALVGGADVYDPLDGRLSELFVGNKLSFLPPRLRVKITGHSPLLNPGLKQVKLFAHGGDAVCRLNLSSDWGAKHDSSCVLEVELNAEWMKKHGPPLYSIVFYDEKRDGSVSGLVRYLTCVRHLIEANAHAIVMAPLGSVLEIYQPQPEDQRKTLNLTVSVSGGTPEFWRQVFALPRICEMGPGGQPVGFYTYDDLLERWAAQDREALSAGLTINDPILNCVSLPFVDMGGPVVGMLLPFGSGFVSRVRDQPIDPATLMVLARVGQFLANGPAGLSAPNLGSSVYQRRQVVQTTCSLLGSLTPYMNDRRTMHSGQGDAPVESPNYFREGEADSRTDCEDDSIGVSALFVGLQKLVHQPDHHLAEEQLPLEEDVRLFGPRPATTTETLAPASEWQHVTTQEWHQELSSSLKGDLDERIEPIPTLVDHWDKRGTISRSDGSHIAHETVTLVALKPSHNNNELVQDWSWSVDRAYAGLIIDSIHPLVSPDPNSWQAVDREAAWLDSVLRKVHGDVRAARVLVPGSPYHSLDHVLKVARIDGREYVPVHNRQLGFHIGHLAEASFRPYVPVFDEATLAKHRLLADLQYPLRPITLHDKASLSLVCVLADPNSAHLDLSQPPTAHAILPNFTREMVTNSQVISHLTNSLTLKRQSSHTTCLMLCELRLPGVAPTCILVLSWVMSSKRR